MPEARLVGLHWLHPAKPSAQRLCFGKGLLPGPRGGLEDAAVTPTAPPAAHTGTASDRSSVLPAARSLQPSPPWTQQPRASAAPTAAARFARLAGRQRGCRRGEGLARHTGGLCGSSGGHRSARRAGRRGGARPPPTHEHQSPPKRPVPWPARLSPVLCPGERVPSPGSGVPLPGSPC